MFWFYVPCEIVLFSESGSTIIASESHVIALKVGNKLTNFANSPLFITYVFPWEFISSQLPGLATFTFVSSQLPGLATFTFYLIKTRKKLGSLSILGFLSKLVLQEGNNNRGECLRQVVVLGPKHSRVNTHSWGKKRIIGISQQTSSYCKQPEVSQPARRGLGFQVQAMTTRN